MTVSVDLHMYLTEELYQNYNMVDFNLLMLLLFFVLKQKKHFLNASFFYYWFFCVES